MANGTTKKIADVAVGDEVLATDPETGETGARKVLATLPHTDQLLTLRTSSGDVVTTEDHKYWNETDREWQESQDLDEGDRLLTADGDEVTVEGLDWTSVHTAPAYDLDIAGIDSYYVGAGDEAVLVHNCNVTISKIAPDWAQKGAHVHVDGVELAVRPGAGGTVVFKPVFSNAGDASRAIAQAEAALQNPTFRAQLLRDVTRARDYLRTSGLHGADAKAGELHFLIAALEKMG